MHFLIIYKWGHDILKVKLEKYNPKWKFLFETEKEKLLNVLGPYEFK